jgi:hypothetical protein
MVKLQSLSELNARAEQARRDFAVALADNMRLHTEAKTLLNRLNKGIDAFETMQRHSHEAVRESSDLRTRRQ